MLDVTQVDDSLPTPNAGPEGSMQNPMDAQPADGWGAADGGSRHAGFQWWFVGYTSQRNAPIAKGSNLYRETVAPEFSGEPRTIECPFSAANFKISTKVVFSILAMASSVLL